MVKVEPLVSSGFSFLERARSARSLRCVEAGLIHLPLGEDLLHAPDGDGAALDDRPVCRIHGDFKRLLDGHDDALVLARALAHEAGDEVDLLVRQDARAGVPALLAAGLVAVLLRELTQVRLRVAAHARVLGIDAAPLAPGGYSEFFNHFGLPHAA